MSSKISWLEKSRLLEVKELLKRQDDEVTDVMITGIAGRRKRNGDVEMLKRKRSISFFLLVIFYYFFSWKREILKIIYHAARTTESKERSNKLNLKQSWNT